MDSEINWHTSRHHEFTLTTETATERIVDLCFNACRRGSAARISESVPAIFEISSNKARAGASNTIAAGREDLELTKRTVASPAPTHRNQRTRNRP
jgi:hypothetical protein